MPRSKRAEQVPQQSASGLGQLRLAQLAADLRLTPEERVRAAEETARASRSAIRPQYVIAFDRLEDYFAWKDLENLGA